MVRVLVSILCLVALSACDPIVTNVTYEQGRSDGYGDVEGVVKLDEGGVAAGIHVALVRKTSTCNLCWYGSYTRTTVAEVEADENGNFKFEHVRTGYYVINLGGYEDYFTWGDRSVNVYADRTSSVNFTIGHLP